MAAGAGSHQILLIGESKSKGFAPAMVRRGFNVDITHSGSHGIDAAGKGKVDVAVLDTLALRTNGRRICQRLREQLPLGLVILIAATDPGHWDQLGADLVLVPPFTYRKLINAIERLLQTRSHHPLRCGPFAMNPTNNILIAHGEEITLTPKQSQLLEFFFRHPGETIERSRLMKEIWQTDYVGDTRTLDVHIRWLRQALEPGKGKPRYLKTIRGVGYCLEIPDSEK